MGVFSVFQNQSENVINNQNTVQVPAVNAGFPSPAQDYEEKKLDLNQKFIKHPAATFFVRCKTEAMSGAGVFFDDLLIVDRSLDAKAGDVVVAYYDGKFVVRRLTFSNKKSKKAGGVTVLPNPNKNRVVLEAENKKYKPLAVEGDEDFMLWGVVSCVVHSYR